jgi:hypothetical protein
LGIACCPCPTQAGRSLVRPVLCAAYFFIYELFFGGILSLSNVYDIFLCFFLLVQKETCLPTGRPKRTPKNLPDAGGLATAIKKVEVVITKKIS